MEDILCSVDCYVFHLLELSQPQECRWLTQLLNFPSASWQLRTLEIPLCQSQIHIFFEPRFSQNPRHCCSWDCWSCYADSHLVIWIHLAETRIAKPRISQQVGPGETRRLQMGMEGKLNAFFSFHNNKLMHEMKERWFLDIFNQNLKQKWVVLTSHCFWFHNSADLAFLFESVGFPWAQLIKNPPAMLETWVQSLGWEDPLEMEMATQSCTLSWEIPWRQEPGYCPWACRRVCHDLATKPSHISSGRSVGNNQICRTLRSLLFFFFFYFYHFLLYISLVLFLFISKWR